MKPDRIPFGARRPSARRLESQTVSGNDGISRNMRLICRKAGREGKGEIHVRNARNTCRGSRTRGYRDQGDAGGQATRQGLASDLRDVTRRPGFRRTGSARPRDPRTSAEEQFRGWLAQIHRIHDPHRQVAAYERLQRRIEFFAAWEVLPWTEQAADILVDLRRRGIRIGTLDLKIAAIALSHEATLLSRNLVDFAQVPRLVVEDWT